MKKIVSNVIVVSYVVLVVSFFLKNLILSIVAGVALSFGLLCALTYITSRMPPRGYWEKFNTKKETV